MEIILHIINSIRIFVNSTLDAPAVLLTIPSSSLRPRCTQYLAHCKDVFNSQNISITNGKSSKQQS